MIKINFINQLAKMLISTDYKKNELTDKNHKKPVKILFLSHTAGLDGAERSLLTLLKGLHKERYDPIVLLPNNGPLKEKIEQLEIKTIVYSIPRWIAFHPEYSILHFKEVFVGIFKRLIFLCKVVKTERIDIIYTNTITILDGAIVARMKHMPHIWHIREILYNNPSLKPYLPICLVKFVVNLLSSKIITNSIATAENIKLQKKNKENKIVTIYNGFDVTEFDVASSVNVNNEDLRTELKLDRETKIIASIGRIGEDKGQVDLIDAAKIVMHCFQNVAFIFVGNGSYNLLNKLRNKIQGLNLENNIYFCNFRKNIIPIYRSIDILVSASWLESFGRTIIEAMLCEKPVVATKSGGPEEIIVEGKTGLLVPVKSPVDLANALIKLLSNSNLAKEMGQNGRNRSLQLCSLTKYISSVENIIDFVIQ